MKKALLALALICLLGGVALATERFVPLEQVPWNWADIDNNGVVDIYDVVTICGPQYGLDGIGDIEPIEEVWETPEATPHNPDPEPVLVGYNVGNGVVDIFDVVMACASYGMKK